MDTRMKSSILSCWDGSSPTDMMGPDNSGLSGEDDFKPISVGAICWNYPGPNEGPYNRE